MGDWFPSPFSKRAEVFNPSLKGVDIYGFERDASENLRTRTHYIALR